MICSQTCAPLLAPNVQRRELISREIKNHELARERFVNEKQRDPVHLQVEQFLERYHREYTGEDFARCMSSPTCSPKEERLPLQRGRRLVLDECDGSQSSHRTISKKSMKSVVSTTSHHSQNTNSRAATQRKSAKPRKKQVVNDKIADKDMERMRRICGQLGIYEAKGVKVDVQLYGYPTHLDVYKALLRMVQMEEGPRQVVVEGLTANRMRDIKVLCGLFVICHLSLWRWWCFDLFRFIHF